jgi:predicted membrane metal-binding protein
MMFAIISIIYAGTILFFVGTAALILLAWARRRYPDRSPGDLTYIAVSIILLVSAGIGIFVASQIAVALGYVG